MKQPRVRLLTRGDDLGSTHTANVAICDAFRDGILKNASIMVPCPAFEEAAAVIADEPGLCCGLHCTVTAEWDSLRWGPVLLPERVPSLVDARGHFFQTTQALHQNGPRLNEIMAELQAQLERARAVGINIRYADQHMVFGWVIEGLDEAFDAWCDREGIRNDRLYGRGLPRIDAPGDPVEQMIARLEEAPPGQYRVVGHPAYATPEMYALGHEGYPGEVVAVERDWQRRAFMDPRIVRYCRENGVLPIRYDEASVLST
jgi:hypothetical protein